MSASDTAVDLRAPARGSSAAAIRTIFIATFVITAFLIVTPLAALLYGSFRTGGPGTNATYTLEQLAGLAGAAASSTRCSPRCFISVVTSLFSSAFGGAMAWLIYRTDFRFKRSARRRDRAELLLSRLHPGDGLGHPRLAGRHLQRHPGRCARHRLRAVRHLLALAGSSGSRCCISRRSRSSRCAAR